MNDKFLRIPTPHQGEGLPGYLIRLCNHNHYKLSWLYSKLGINTNRYTTNLFSEHSIESLSKLTSIDLAILTEMAFKVTDSKKKRIEFNEQNRISRSYLFVQRTRLCPECLQEESYTKKEWDVIALTCCIKHFCFLLEKCPECQRNIKQYRDSLYHCICGYDYRQTKTRSINEKEMIVNKILSKLCNEADFRLEYPLHALNFNEVLNLLFMLIQSLKVRVDGFWERKITVEMMHNMMLEAYSVFEEWPASFYNYLDYMKNNNRKNNVSTRNKSLVRDFGKFYTRLLYDTFASDSFDFIRTEFERYVVNHLEDYIASLDSTKIGLFKHNGFISGKRAAKILSIKTKSLKQLITNHRIKGTIVNYKHVDYMLVSAGSLYDFKLILDSSLSFKDVKEHLGIDSTFLNKLINRSHIDPFISPDKDGIPLLWRFYKGTIERFVTKLLNHCSYVTEILPNLIVFSRALEKFSPFGLKSVDLVEFIFAYKLRPVYLRDDTFSIRKIMFRKEEIEELLKDLYCQIILNKDYVSARQAALALGTQAENVVSWFNKGLLDGSVQNTGYRIIKKSIDNFKHAYITSYEIKKLTYLTISQIKRNGIVAISGPKIDGLRIYLFNRNEIMELINILRTQSDPIEQSKAKLIIPLEENK